MVRDIQGVCSWGSVRVKALLSRGLRGGAARGLQSQVERLTLKVISIMACRITQELAMDRGQQTGQNPQEEGKQLQVCVGK